MIAYLFLNFMALSKVDIREMHILSDRIDEVLGIKTTVINFFTSEMSELALLSKFRIVYTPTFVIVHKDIKNKLVLRINEIPSVASIDAFFKLLKDNEGEQNGS
jgi:hypothetical protein